MEITSVRQLQALIRGRRADLHLSQDALAKKAGVSRKWVSESERGRMAGAELALVLRVLAALDLVLDAQPTAAGPSRRDHDGPSVTQGDDVDLDDVLARHVIR